MVGWRMKLHATEIPELVRIGRARLNAYVSQEDMALLTGVTVKWYGELERGNWQRKYSDDFLMRVADVLRLNEGQWTALYQLVNQQEPPPRYDPRPHKPMPTESIETWFSLTPFPAFICDAAWEITYANEPTGAWFEGLVQEGNYMRWMLCHPAAQRQFVDWEPVARLMLAQLTAQAARLPDVETIKTVIRQILDRSQAASRWWAREPDVWMHEDGNLRTIYLPDAPEPTTVEMISTNPLRDCHLRTYTTMPLRGYVPAQCRIPSTLPAQTTQVTGRVAHQPRIA